jgi:hypothetical protein
MRNGLLIAILTLLFISCGGDDGTGPDDGGSNGDVPMPTPVGTSNGAPVSGTIGAAGGSLTSSDGLFTVDVPPGALASDTLITIQPITNTAHGGDGNAYRLTPDGLTFALPVDVTVDLTDSLLAGTDTSFVDIAVQRDSGIWVVEGTRTLDWNARTLTRTTTHFSAFAPHSQCEIVPPGAFLEPTQSVALEARVCVHRTYRLGPDQFGQYETIEALVACSPTSVIRNWSVNGVVGGNSTVGTVTTGAHVTYTAPASTPTPNTVAVSVETNVKGVWTLLVAHVTILGAPEWSGSIEVDYGDGESAIALVSWTLIGTVPGIRLYAPSGTVRYAIVPQCQLISFGPNVGIIDANGSGSILLYPDKNPPTVDMYFSATPWTAQICTLCPNSDPGCKDITIGPAWALSDVEVQGNLIAGTTVVGNVTYTYHFDKAVPSP